MKKYLFFFIFVSIAQLFYGQEKYTVQGELPDHSLDDSYLRLVNSSALSQEYERIKHSFIDSILVVDGKFYYEGTLLQKPFLAHLSSVKTGRNMLNLSTYFVVEAGDIYMIAPKKDKEKKLFFLEKYAQYPDVIRFHLSIYLNGRGALKNPDYPKYLQIIDRMPKADRDILLAWRDYVIKKEEYREKTKPILDSIRDNAPRFIETISSSSSAAIMKNE